MSNNSPRSIKKKIPVIVVNGFLEAGKTSFLQDLIVSLTAKYNNRGVNTDLKPALISCEQGEVELALDLEGKLVFHEQILRSKNFTVNHLRQVIENTAPDLLLIEYNGTWPVELLQQSLPADLTFIQTMIWVQDLKRLDLEATGMGSLLQEGVRQSDVVLFKTDSKASAEYSLQVAKRKLSAFNTHLKFYDWVKGEELSKKLFKHILREQLGIGIQLLFGGLAFWALWLLRAVLALPNMIYWQEKAVKAFDYFFALLFQILPFLLVASLASSIIQVFLTDNRVRKWLTKPRYLGLPIALLSGSIIPVCDCGLVPIVTRLIKKGTRLPIALLFFVASTVTNPLVILSTLYAFPGRPIVYFYRLGIVVATGLILTVVISRWEQRQGRGWQQEVADLVCVSGYVGKIDNRDWNAKLIVILRHTMQEFFTLIPYILLGSFLSAVVHALVVPADLQAVVTNKLALYIMLLLGCVLLAVCANSNAFIAKSFASFVPLPAILLYLAFSPLLDVKNILLLANGFGRRLAVKYLLIIILLFTALFLLFGQLPANFWPSLGILI